MSDLRGALMCMLLGVLMLFLLAFLVVSEADGQEALHVDGVIDSQSSMCDGGCMNKESVSKASICSGACMTAIGEAPEGPVFAALPENPAPQTNVCYRGTIDAAGQTTYREIDCGLVPSWRELPKKTVPAKAGFFAMGRYDAPAPLRTARQTLDKKFIILHGAGALAMVLACRRSRTSGEDWGSEVPAVLGVTGMDFLVSHYVSESLSVEAPVYMFQHYMRAAYR